MFPGREGPGRGDTRASVCVVCRGTPSPGLCVLIMDWTCLLIRATISGLPLDSDVVRVADTSRDDHSGDDSVRSPVPPQSLLSRFRGSMVVRRGLGGAGSSPWLCHKQVAPLATTCPQLGFSFCPERCPPSAFCSKAAAEAKYAREPQYRSSLKSVLSNTRPVTSVRFEPTRQERKTSGVTVNTPLPGQGARREQDCGTNP